jgi:hypothetical protein
MGLCAKCIGEKNAVVGDRYAVDQLLPNASLTLSNAMKFGNQPAVRIRFSRDKRPTRLRDPEEHA